MESQSNSGTLSQIPSLVQSVINENPKSIPSPPKDLVEFRLLSKYEQLKISDKFYQQEHIKVYLEDKWKAELHNRDCFIWLWEVYSGKWNVELNDQQRHALETKMTQFKRVIVAQEKPYPALLLDFEKHQFKAPGEIKSQNVAWDE